MVIKRKPIWPGLLLMAAVLLFCRSVGAEVIAELDRDTIHIDETVRLVLKTDDVDNQARPDLSPLEQNFKLLGTSVNQNISVTNGIQVAEKMWVTELEPKSPGSFTIPAIKIGTEITRPIRLTVLPENLAMPASNRDIIVELDISPSTVYVQEQATVSVRLYLGINLLDGSLSDPAPENADVRRLGKDTQFSKKINGRSYRVVERKYAVFPQSSGELEIPAVRFQGLAQDSGSTNQAFSSLFNQGTKVSAKSKPVFITVDPPDSKFSGRQWLPARDLTVADLSDTLETAQVGQPVTRRFQIRSTGLAAEQLPELEFPQSSEYRVYPDRPIRNSSSDGDFITSTLEQSVAFIASEPGEFSLPGLEISWWNTVLDKMETAILPPYRLQVNETNPDAGDNSQLAVQTQAQNDNLQPAANSVTANAGDWPWQWISIFMLAGWMLTTIYFWHRIRNSRSADESGPEPAHQTTGQLRTEINQACARNDPHLTRALTVRWARDTLGDGFNGNLEDAAAIIDPNPLAQAIRNLDRYLYSANTTFDESWNGGEFSRAMANYTPDKSLTENSKASALPELYPSAA